MSSIARLTNSNADKILTVYSRPVIDNELERLDEDLQEFRDILKRYHQRDRVSMLERLKYASLDKSRLEDLQSKFSQSKEKIGDMLKLSNMNANDVQIRKVDQILEKQDLESQARKTERCERQEDSQLILAAINRLNDLLSTSGISATHRTQEQIIDSFESELRNEGLLEDKAKGVLLRAREELLETTSVSSSSSPLANLAHNTHHQEIPPVEAHPSQRSISQPRESPSLQLSANSSNLLGHLATEQKATEQKATEQKATEQKAAEQKAAEQKASQPLNSNISDNSPSPPPTTKTSSVNISNKTSTTPDLNKCSDPAAENCRILCVDASHGSKPTLSNRP